jgi:hypothetical protein
MIYSNNWLNSNIQNSKIGSFKHQNNDEQKSSQLSLFGGLDLDDSFVKVKDIPSLPFEQIMNQILNSQVKSLAKELILNYDPTGPIPFPKNIEDSLQTNQNYDTINKVLRIEPESCIDFTNQIPYTNAFKYLYDILGSTFNDYPLDKFAGQIIVDPSVILSFYQDINYNPEQNSISIAQAKNFLISKEIDPFMVTELRIDLETDGLLGKTVCTISMTRLKETSQLSLFDII